MSDKKAFAYFRVGNAEQLGEATDNRVFLYGLNPPSPGKIALR